MRKLALLLCLFVLAFTVSAQDTAQEALTTRAAAPDASQIRLIEVAADFVRPLYVTHSGDGSGRLFVLEQGGRIYILENGQRRQIPFLDITNLVSPEANSNQYTERGLLGLAFAPDYATSGVFYVNYTDTTGTTQIARYTVSPSDPTVANPNSAQIIMTQSQPYPNHNGGHMAFGPDGFLYIAMGDGGAAGDPEGRAQNLETKLGKILRIDVNGQDTYTIPSTNPFVGSGYAEEIWAYGVRNPWRFSFDRATGDLYIADVGQNMWEEVNFQPASSAGGENYGWDIFEGSRPYEGGTLANAVMPIAEYSHNEGISISGGYVYRGTEVPELQGAYVYGDFGSGVIWTAWRSEAGEWQSRVLMDTNNSISSFGEDENGELYVVNYGGSILRFAPAS